MALLPIDLQTLFSQAQQVGKEQAAQKEAPPAAQAAQGQQLAQRAETRDHAVNETHNQEEGAERVKDRSRRGAQRRGPRDRKEKPGPGKPPSKPPAARPPASNVVSDPDLGRHIDVSG